MKTKSLFLLTLSLLAMMLPAARGVDQIYNGTATFTTLGGGQNLKTRGGVFIVVNLSTRQYVEIRFFTQGRVKLFEADPARFLTTFYVEAPRNQTFKEIVTAETTQSMTEATSTLFELNGKTTVQQYQSQPVRSMPIPKTMSGFLKQVHLIFADGPVLESQAIVLHYNQALTILANDLGGDLGSGVAQVNAFLKSKGFQSVN